MARFGRKSRVGSALCPRQAAENSGVHRESSKVLPSTRISLASRWPDTPSSSRVVAPVLARHPGANGCGEHRMAFIGLLTSVGVLALIGNQPAFRRESGSTSPALFVGWTLAEQAPGQLILLTNAGYIAGSGRDVPQGTFTRMMSPGAAAPPCFTIAKTPARNDAPAGVRWINVRFKPFWKRSI
jgi:hypothetical protein